MHIRKGWARLIKPFSYRGALLSHEKPWGDNGKRKARANLAVAAGPDEATYFARRAGSFDAALSFRARQHTHD